MNMKRLLTLVAFFATLHASAQQVNPVPDYVFANRMSAGRNTVTDTAAYLSIGPRYGATRGMMPPMVVDTASFSGNRRNGLLIFSVQKNKFLYWDSVGVKWAEMAGTGGSAITGSGVAGYMPEFTTSTNLDTTSLYHTSGRFGFGTSSPLRKLHVNDTILSRSIIIDSINGFATALSRPTSPSTLMIGGSMSSVNRATQSGFITSQTFYTDRFGDSALRTGDEAAQFFYRAKFRDSQTGWQTNDSAIIGQYKVQYKTFANGRPTARQHFLAKDSNNTTQIYFDIDPALFTITNNMNTNVLGELRVNSSTDLGAYTLQNSGDFYNTTSAFIAATSGNLAVGTTSPQSKLHLKQTRNVNGMLIEMGNRNAANDYAQIGFTFDPYTTTTLSAIRSSFADPFASFETYMSFFTYGSSFTERMRIKADGEILMGYTSDQGTYILQANGNALVNGNLRTAAPSGGTANDWRLGTVATVSPTSPNRTIEVSIGGTIYYIAAKTTND